MTDTTIANATAGKPTTAAPLQVPEQAADLDAGLRRLKLAAIRRTAPEVLLTAKTQRWTPEEVLRTLVESELAARDASNIQPTQSGGVPCHEDIGIVRRRCVIDPAQSLQSL